jgi:cytoskeletal protein RodZ
MTIGNQLKKARQKKQVTLKDVYAYTKIQPDMLSALEDDNFQKIPNPVYVKSFLKEYARYLGLDAGQILNEYAQLHEKEFFEEDRHAEERPKTSMRKTIDTQYIKSIRLVFIGIILIVLLLYSFKLLARVRQGVVEWNRSRIERIALKKGMTQEKPKEKPKQKLQETLQQKHAQPLATEKSAVKQESVSIPENEKLHLALKANQDVWIELKRDGVIIFKSVLKKDITREWQADDDFELWTGNASVMDITLNGVNLGSPGRGVKRGIIINRQGIKK